MAQPRLPAIAIALKADRWLISTLRPSLLSNFCKVLQPIGAGGDAGIVHGYAFPADLLQFSAHEHGADGHLAYRGHALPEKFLRSALIFNFRKISSSSSCWPCPPLDKALPAKRHGIAWDKDKLPATFFK